MASKETRKTFTRADGNPLTILAGFSMMLFLPSCGADSWDAPAYTVRDSAGVEIVESVAPLWGEGEGWRVGPEATVRLGVLEGDPAHQFNGVVGAGILADGSLVVGDGGSQELRFFDPQGRHLRTVGRSGEGPGEFLGLSILGIAPGGREVWAYDFSLRRLTWFDEEGGLLEVVSLALDPPTLNAVGPLPNGAFVLKQLWGSRVAAQENTLGLQRDPLAWVIFDETGALVDTVAVVPGRELFLFEENGRRVMSTPPFARNSVGTLRGGRVVVGDQEAYELREFAVDGVLLRILRIPDRVEGVDGSDLEAYIQGRLAEAPPEQHPTIRNALEGMTFSDTKPAYGEVFGDAEGNLWLGEWTIFPEVATVWTVMDDGGRWLGAVELPPTFSPLEIGRDWILGVERDELDVEYVTLYPLLKDVAHAHPYASSGLASGGASPGVALSPGPGSHIPL